MLFVTFKLSQLIEDDQRDANCADSMEVDSNDDMVRGCQLSLSLDLCYMCRSNIYHSMMTKGMQIPLIMYANSAGFN
jgi:hypothetical protein